MSLADQDLIYLQSSLPVLEDFLISGDIFIRLDLPQTAAGEIIPSQLSLGAVLLARARISTAQTTMQVAGIDAKITALRTHWRVNWEAKAARELPERLRLWRNALGELLEEGEVGRHAYSWEVRHRVMAQLLADEISSLPGAVEAEIAALDIQLRGIFCPGEFCWDANLMAEFTPTKYWFLYGKLVTTHFS